MQILAQSVQQQLQPLATQEFIDQLLVGLNALQEHQYVDHELEVINALDGSDSDINIIQQTHDAVMNHLHSVCTLHRVKVNPDATLREVALVVKALLLMQYWEDAQTIIDICTSDADDIDRLAKLVSTVGELSELKAGDVLEEVDPNFLRGLQNIYTTGALNTEDPADFNVPDDQLDKLRQWRNLMGAERSLGYRMIRSGYRPGAALEQYIKRVIISLGEKDNKDLAAELMPFILMSRDGWENPLLAWRDISKTLQLELADITAVDVEIIRLLGEFDRLKNQGTAK